MQQLNTKPLITIRAITCVQSDAAKELISQLLQQITCDNCDCMEELERVLQGETLLTLPEILLLEITDDQQGFAVVERIRRNVMLSGMIIIALSTSKNPQWIERARNLKIHDYYEHPYPVEDICERMSFLIKFKLIRPTISELLHKEESNTSLAMPIWKRFFDILFSGTLLLALSPVMLVTAILIRLESKGPVVYRSKRVGTGYKIFHFYKFRSMYPDADKRLEELSAFNQYSGTDEGGKAAFIKLKDDPRITRVGRFIRKTSIDELPQLFNILKGDMSTVGNRPLPLYEAELLTSNEWSWRFLAPSGLTGLWQVSRRGRADMSERERKKLDNFYAKKYSMLFDLKIIMKTLPAVFQKENV